MLGQGSFGITYLASIKTTVAGPLGEITSKSYVAIKEFFKSYDSQFGVAEDSKGIDIVDGTFSVKDMDGDIHVSYKRV